MRAGNGGDTIDVQSNHCEGLMDCFPSYGRRFVRGSIVTALLLGAAAVPNAGAQVSQERLPQNNGSTTSSRTSVLLFDASSLSLNDAQVLVNSALRWVEPGQTAS